MATRFWAVRTRFKLMALAVPGTSAFVPPNYTPPNSDSLSPPRLRAVLAARSMTFARLAQSLDVSERYLGFVVNGQRQSAPLLQALRLHLGESAWRFVCLRSNVLDISELPAIERSGGTP